MVTARGGMCKASGQVRTERAEAGSGGCSSTSNGLIASIFAPADVYTK